VSLAEGLLSDINVEHAEGVQLKQVTVADGDWVATAI
jgi:hypothetical protein